jgi:hypothetical protein
MRWAFSLRQPGASRAHQFPSGIHVVGPRMRDRNSAAFLIQVAVGTILVASFVSTPARAQEPSPTATAPVSSTPGVAPPGEPQPATICDRTPSFFRPGGSRISMDVVSLTLPFDRGDFAVTLLPRLPGPNLILICHLDSRSGIAVETLTGSAVGREVGDPSGAAVLDQILASVRVEVTPTPTLSDGAITPTPTSRITAPSTGNAGLR